MPAIGEYQVVTITHAPHHPSIGPYRTSSGALSPTGTVTNRTNRCSRATGRRSSTTPSNSTSSGISRTAPDRNWLELWLDGPVLDPGAGASRDSLHVQHQFEAGRFQSALAIGTQLCLAGSMQGLGSSSPALPTSRRPTALQSLTAGTRRSIPCTRCSGSGRTRRRVLPTQSSASSTSTRWAKDSTSGSSVFKGPAKPRKLRAGQ